MRFIKKKSLTLLEVAIALFLTTLLITTLFRFYTESQLVEKKMYAAKEAILQKQHIQVRLNQIFSQIPAAFSFADKNPAFYTHVFPGETISSLVFLFDNGIDPVPEFSGPVLGRLYLDKKKNVNLIIWPTEKRKSMLFRKELLMTNVSTLSLQFFCIDSKTKKTNWKTEWKSLDLPAMIEISMEKEEKIIFSFSLPIPEPLITYYEKKVVM